MADQQDNSDRTETGARQPLEEQISGLVNIMTKFMDRMTDISADNNSLHKELAEQREENARLRAAAAARIADATNNGPNLS